LLLLLIPVIIFNSGSTLALTLLIRPTLFAHLSAGSEPLLRRLCAAS
jgi:hypothetical protein